jgi:hypothetical protein
MIPKFYVESLPVSPEIVEEDLTATDVGDLVDWTSKDRVLSFPGCPISSCRACNTVGICAASKTSCCRSSSSMVVILYKMFQK